MRLKRKSKRARDKGYLTNRWILCFLSEKEEKVLIKNGLIGVTTKFEPALMEMGGHHNTYPFPHDEEKDDDLDAATVSTWHYNTHLVINNEKTRKEMGCITYY